MSATRSPEARRIYWRTVWILVAILLSVTGAGFYVLYQMSLDRARENLAELVGAQARIMESVSKHNAYFQSGVVPGAARSATLSQFKEGYRSFTGFGNSGEFVLAEQVGDEMVFLLPARKLDFHTPPPISLQAAEAKAMKAALGVGSGTIIGPDYHGDRVLAAYEWLPFMEMGLVAKIDMAEFNSPFFRSGLIAALLALGTILVGAALNARAVSPLVERILESAAIIREREANYRQLVDTIPGIVYQAEVDENLTMRELNDPIVDLAGRPATAFIGNAEIPFLEIVLPEDRPAALVQDDGDFKLDYRIERPDGEIRWISDNGSIAETSDGQRVRKGILLDITARKEAEQALEELPRKLSRYISPQVYKSIFQGRQDAEVGSARKKLTVFFSDVVNFTRKSESLDPDDLTFIINSYLNRMAELAVGHGGTLDKFIGDGVLIFFGDPDSQGVREDACSCLDMALEMLEEIGKLNEAALDHGINAPLEIRIGIATGYCTVGNFGSESRMDYTVLGKTVNLAARLESSAPTQGILIASDTELLVKDRFQCEPSEPIRAKGFEKPVPVFRVWGKTPE